MLDIFNSDAFSVVSLTDALRDVKPRPSRLGDMGIFEVSGVTTTTIAIERIGATLKLVGATPRGGPGETRDYAKRSIDPFPIPHFQRDWSVNADEVQGVREFGTDNNLQTIQGIVMDRMQVNLDDLDLSDEFSRMGAIQGSIVYKGGNTIDLFSKFGVAQAPEFNFDLTNDAPVDGALREMCTKVIRKIRTAVGGLKFQYVHAMVGDDFFDDLLRHREVRDTYRGWSETRILRESYVGKNRASNPIFEFGGIVWENYGIVESDDDLALIGIDTDKAKFFPVGVPRLFRTYYAPADYIESVNTPGLRTYAKQWPKQNGKGINGETQRNVLHLCTRPNALLRGRRT